MAAETDGVFKVKEAAEYLKISNATFSKLGIPFIIIGQRKFWRKADIDQWVQSRKTEGEGK